jgi:hypothetical protein
MGWKSSLDELNSLFEMDLFELMLIYDSDIIFIVSIDGVKINGTIVNPRGGDGDINLTSYIGNVKI